MTINLPNSAKALIALVAAASLLTVALGLTQRHEASQWLSFSLLAIAAVVASRFKVKLPGMTSTMSGNLPVILLAMVWLDLLQTCLIAALGALAQSFLAQGKKPRAIHVVFSACVLMDAAALAYATFHGAIRYDGAAVTLAWLAAATGVYFLANTVPVAGIIAITEGKKLLPLWRHVFLWSFPNYVIGAGLSGIVASLSRLVAWEAVVTLLLVLYGVYRSYKMYVTVQQTASVHAIAAGAGQ